MRLVGLLIFAAYWLVVLPVAAQDEPRSNQSEAKPQISEIKKPDAKTVSMFRFEMDDKSRVIGAPNIEYLELDLGYAQLNIPLSKIRSVISLDAPYALDEDEDGPADDPFGSALVPSSHLPGSFSVLLKNNDQMTGRIINEKFKVDFIAGRLTLPIDRVLAFGAVGEVLELPNQTGGLIAHYSFNKISLGFIGNEVGSFHAASSTAELKSGGKGSQPNDKFARFSGQAKIQVPHSIELCPQKITMSAWVKPKAGTRNGYAFIAGKTTADNWKDGYGFIYMPNDPVHIYFYVNGYQSVVTKVEVDDNKWTHLTGVYDGETLKLYKNGKKVDSAAGKGVFVHANAPFTIGSDPSHYHWHGDIDEVKLFGRALSALEVKAVHAGRD